MALTKTEIAALNDISKKLEVNPYWLYTLINFESKWLVNAKNPKSTARGLIQFIDSTAQNLGYKNSMDLVEKNPTIETQLKIPVYDYLKQYKPFPTKQALYMAVFYPGARLWPINAVFPENVRKNNPGINTVNDYINLVEKKNLSYGVNFILISMLSLVIFLLNRKRKGFKK
jgi:hypothetical protein